MQIILCGSATKQHMPKEPTNTCSVYNHVGTWVQELRSQKLGRGVLKENRWEAKSRAEKTLKMRPEKNKKSFRALPRSEIAQKRKLQIFQCTNHGFIFPLVVENLAPLAKPLGPHVISSGFAWKLHFVKFFRCGSETIRG